MKIRVFIENGGLKQNRELSGMSREKLAEKTGIDIQKIRQYEEGILDLNQASLKTLLKICRAVGCELSAILTDPETLSELEKYEDDDDSSPDDAESSADNNSAIIENLTGIAEKLKK